MPPGSRNDSLWLPVAGLYCILFGLALIVNIHPVGDGLWFWYATDYRAGLHLYSSLHLPLQPLFIEVTAFEQRLLGDGWLSSKVVAAAQLIVYVVLIALIAGRLPWKGWQKALLVCAVFQLTLSANYFRFDDYHITGYCLELFCVLLLLRLDDGWPASRILAAAASIGIACGLSTGNRLNDGGALLVGCVLCVLILVPRHRLAAAAVLCGAALATLMGVIALTGDPYATWVSESITKAAKIKGGGGSLTTSAVQFPFVMARDFFADTREITGLLLLCAIALVFVWAAHRYRTLSGPGWKRLLWPAAVLFALSPVLAYYARREQPDRSLGFIGVPVAYALFLWSAWLLLRPARAQTRSRWHSGYVLLSIPVLQLLAGSVTSGKSVLETFPAIALLLLLIPLVYRDGFREGQWRRPAILGACATIALAGSVAKFWQPYYWHHFSDHTLFTHRVWYDHPLYGPMYVDRDQLAMMQSFCAPIDTDRSGGLLSLPYPYANYFCGVTPWHQYVQTWYDTSGKEQIDRLRADLADHPPRWIVYQRGLDTMASHEKAFLGGRPLPHRQLDQLIVSRVENHQWSIVRQQEFGHVQWLLIETRP